MSVFKDILQEERKRLIALKNKYEEGDKVKFEYIGKADSEKYRLLQKELSKRHEFLDKLKQVNKELGELSKPAHEE
jgi:hypothetical protein